MTINTFVRKLSNFGGDTIFNPYADICPIHDRSDAPKIRRSNIRRMIKALYEGDTTTLWVARDLGYRGGRRTGLALTDEVHLSHLGEKLGTGEFLRATKGPAVVERTATVIWDTLLRIEEPVMLWNVFPFHPHEATNPMSNRCHTRRERDYAEPLLLELINLLKPKRIVAIGRDAALALSDMSLAVSQVRHPSYGGQTEFVRQLEEIYNLKPRLLRQQQLKFPKVVVA